PISDAAVPAADAARLARIGAGRTARRVGPYRPPRRGAATGAGLPGGRAAVDDRAADRRGARGAGGHPLGHRRRLPRPREPAFRLRVRRRDGQRAAGGAVPAGGVGAALVSGGVRPGAGRLAGVPGGPAAAATPNGPRFTLREPPAADLAAYASR